MILEPILIYFVIIAILLLLCPRFFGYLAGKLGINKSNAVVIFMAISASLLIFGYFNSHRIEMKKVKSTAINEIGFSVEDKILKIEFSNGDVYKYYDVPVTVLNGLRDAPSKGHYFQLNIRNSGYRYEKVSSNDDFQLEK